MTIRRYITRTPIICLRQEYFRRPSCSQPVNAIVSQRMQVRRLFFRSYDVQRRTLIQTKIQALERTSLWRYNSVVGFLTGICIVHETDEIISTDKRDFLGKTTNGQTKYKCIARQIRFTDRTTGLPPMVQMKYHWAALEWVEVKFPFNPTVLVREFKCTYAYDLETMISFDISTVHEVFVL